MDKLRVIQHAQSYMDMLSKGVDPISGIPVPEDSTLQQERLKKCFCFVSEILTEVIQNDGVVLLSTNSNSASDPTSDVHAITTAEQQIVTISPHQIQSIEVSHAPILPSAFVKRIGKVIDAKTKKKVSLARINRWLQKQGYLSETKVPTIVNKSVKVATPLAAQIGVVEHMVVDKKTGEAKPQLFFTQQAQEYILNNINVIANE